MAAQKIVYLVTSGAYDSYAEEAIMATPELANALAEKLEYPNIIPMPVLDYVPEKVTVYQRLIRLTRQGWVLHPAPDEFVREDLWDFEVPKITAAVSVERDQDGHGSLYQIRISHRDRALVRQTAEDMLTRLRAGGPGELPE